VSPLRDTRRELVRRGYDEAAARYHEARPVDGADLALLDHLEERLAPAARVLDAGCGAGVPVARRLTACGHRVAGVDISHRQLLLARDHVPELSAAEGDMAALPLAGGRFDGLVSYYAVIHVPREDHGALLSEFRRVLRTGGWALVCLGSGDNPQDHDTNSWLGTPMYWSHFDAPSTLALMEDAGLRPELRWEVIDPMGHGSHSFVLAQAI